MNEQKPILVPWHFVEIKETGKTKIFISQDFFGKPGSQPLMVERTPLEFRPTRHGARRGEKMVAYPFSAEDRATAHLLAAAPELLAACKAILHMVVKPEVLMNEDTRQQLLSWTKAAIIKGEGA